MRQPIGRYFGVEYYEEDDPLAPQLSTQTDVFDFGDVKLSEGKKETSLD